MTQGMELSLAIYVSVVVAILGWTFVYHNSRFLARQSEANTAAAAIEKMLQEIADECQSFWGGDTSKAGPLEAQVFSSYVEYRCNFVERKILLIDGKCRDLLKWMPDETFLSSAVDSIGLLRDTATMDAEECAVMEESDRVRKILQVNSCALLLFLSVSEYISVRYKTFLDSTYEMGSKRN